MVDHGLCILTHVPWGCSPGVLRRLPEAIQSLESSCYSGLLRIVDDGSTHPQHLRYLHSLPYMVHYSGACRGIARAKNTCLRIIQDWGVQVGFLAEDDIQFRPGWVNAYLTAHERTGIEHFSWAWNDCRPWGDMWKCHRWINDFEIAQTSIVNGVLLTCTPRVIEKVGGFKVMPAPRWGHEHTNWTKRIIAAGLAPFFADVADSNRLIGLNQFAADSSISDADKALFGPMNEAAAMEIDSARLPLEE